MELTVADLARRAREGEAMAFEELIRRYERVALSVAYGVLHDAAEAGDVTQDAFLRAWQRLNDLQDPAKWRSSPSRCAQTSSARRARPSSRWSRRSASCS